MIGKYEPDLWPRGENMICISVVRWTDRQTDQYRSPADQQL